MPHRKCSGTPISPPNNPTAPTDPSAPPNRPLNKVICATIPGWHRPICTRVNGTVVKLLAVMPPRLPPQQLLLPQPQENGTPISPIPKNSAPTVQNAPTNPTKYAATLATFRGRRNSLRQRLLVVPSMFARGGIGLLRRLCRRLLL